MKKCAWIVVGFGISVLAIGQETDYRYFLDNGIFDPGLSNLRANALVLEGIRSQDPEIVDLTVGALGDYVGRVVNDLPTPYGAPPDRAFAAIPELKQFLIQYWREQHRLSRHGSHGAIMRAVGLDESARIDDLTNADLGLTEGEVSGDEVLEAIRERMPAWPAVPQILCALYPGDLDVLGLLWEMEATDVSADVDVTVLGLLNVGEFSTPEANAFRTDRLALPSDGPMASVAVAFAAEGLMFSHPEEAVPQLISAGFEHPESWGEILITLAGYDDDVLRRHSSEMARLLAQRRVVQPMGALSAAFQRLETLGEQSQLEEEHSPFDTVVVEAGGPRTPTPMRPQSVPQTASAVADVGRLDCDALDEAIAILLAQQRNEYGDFHEGLKGTPKRLLTLELAAESAGFDPEAVRFGRIWLVGSALEYARSRSPYPLPPVSHGGPGVPIDETEAEIVLDTLRRDGDFEGLRGLQGVVVASRDSLGNRHDTNLFGMMIRRYGAEITSWLPSIPTEWSIGAHELAVAIDAAIAAHDFEYLLDFSGIDAAVGWRRGDPIRQVNLAQVAAFHIQPGIMRVLVTRGASPGSDKQSVLDDVLARSAPDRGSSEVEDVVRQLVASGVRPRRPSTLALLEARYPDLSGIGLEADTANALASGAVAEVAGQLGDIRTKWTAEIENLHRRAAHCEKTPNPAATAKWTDSAALTFGEKDRYDQELRAQDEAASRELLASAPSPDDSLLEVSHTLRRGFDSAIDGRWQEAVAAAADVDPLRRSYYLDDLLSLSLRRGAPIEVIEELIELNGGVVPEDAALGLSERYWEGAVTAAEKMSQYGLDLHHVDRFGRNAFSSLARSYPINMDMATFLANHSVSPKPSRGGKDPLDLVLSRMVRMAGVGRSEFGFARLLVSVGAPIESSHRELARRLALLDPQDYRKLVDAIPELQEG